MKYYIEKDENDNIYSCYESPDHLVQGSQAVEVIKAEFDIIKQDVRSFKYSGGTLIENAESAQLADNKQDKLEAVALELANRVKAIIGDSILPGSILREESLVVALEIFMLLTDNAIKSQITLIFQAAKSISADIKSATTNTELKSIDVASNTKWPQG